MKRGKNCAVLLYAAILISVSHATEEKAVAVFDVKSEQLKPGECGAVTNAVTSELRKIPGFRILAWDEVTKILKHRADEPPSSYNDDKCIAKIGDVLEVEYIVAGDVEQMGSRYTVNLRLVDITKAMTVRQVSGTVQHDIGLIVEHMPDMVNELLQREKPVGQTISGSNMKPGKSDESKYKGELKISGPQILKGEMRTGGRSRASIMRVLMQNIAALRYAYNKRLEEKPDLEGKIAIKFAIDEYGKVIFAQVIQSTMKDPKLEKTLVEKIRYWVFSKIDEPGQVAEFVYPFVFSRCED
ncbi:MAG: AgmX/PglI C-terminal domain-containing protein [Fibrobacterota bacterium]